MNKSFFFRSKNGFLKMKLILFCLFSFCVCWSTAKTHKLINHFNGIGEPDSPTTRNALPENKWFIQKLDHFNSSDTRTWRQVEIITSVFFFV